MSGRLWQLAAGRLMLSAHFLFTLWRTALSTGQVGQEIARGFISYIYLCAAVFFGSGREMDAVVCDYLLVSGRCVGIEVVDIS